MKYLFALAIIAVAAYAAFVPANNNVLKDCDNPMLLATHNAYATFTHEKKPVTAPSTMKMCKRLVGKKVCCSQANFDSMKSYFNSYKKKFTKLRQQEVGLLEKVNRTGIEQYTLQIQEDMDEISRGSKSDYLTTKSTAETRKTNKAASEKKWKENMAAGQKNMETTKKLLLSSQKTCFQALFKFQAGQQCLACDADFNKYVETPTDIKISHGTSNIYLNTKTCDALKAACYEYVTTRYAVGTNIKSSATASDSVATLKKSTEALADSKKCREKTGGCTAADIKAIQAKQAELVKKALADYTAKQKLSKTEQETAANKTIKALGDKVTAFQGSDINMVTKMPIGIPYITPDCTSQANCNWICKKFVSGAGAKEIQGAYDYKSLMDNRNGTNARRMLHSDKLMLQYNDTGYDPMAADNQNDLDTTFLDTVVAEGGASSWMVGLSLIVALFVIWIK